MTLARTPAQRLGDVVLVLVAVSALMVVATGAAAGNRPHASVSTFVAYLGLSANGFLFPTFAAACVFSWMDEGRKRDARWALLALFAVAALGAVGEAVFGGAASLGNVDRSASLLQDAATLLMVMGGVTLVLGILSRPPEAAGD